MDRMTNTMSDKEAVDTALLLPRSATARAAVLPDGRVSIQASNPTHATLIAQALQNMGSHVRQYGSVLIVHGEDQ